MKVIFAIGFVICLLGCETKAPVSLGSFSAIDGASKLEVEVPQLVEQVDTLVDVLVDLPLVEVKIDTSTLEGKCKFIVDEFKSGQKHLAYVHDTLLDLNFDSYPDLIIETQLIAGRGIKNGVEAYVFDHEKSYYVRDPFISAMDNPSFYLEDNKISCFHLSFASGYGKEYEWQEGEWIIVKKFEVTNHGKSSVWKVTDDCTNTEDFFNHPFEMVPPREVIQHKF
ncbi:MAG: hypothetical protein ACJA1C_001522 [Crocinitomicaceae bacterium]|jgi:hypothetical protein